VKLYDTKYTSQEVLRLAIEKGASADNDLERLAAKIAWLQAEASLIKFHDSTVCIDSYKQDYRNCVDLHEYLQDANRRAQRKAHEAYVDSLRISANEITSDTDLAEVFNLSLTAEGEWTFDSDF